MTLEDFYDWERTPANATRRKQGEPASDGIFCREDGLVKQKWSECLLLNHTAESHRD